MHVHTSSSGAIYAELSSIVDIAGTTSFTDNVAQVYGGRGFAGFRVILLLPYTDRRLKRHTMYTVGEEPNL